MYNRLLQFLNIKKLLLGFLIPIFTFGYSPLTIDFSQSKDAKTDGTIVVKMTNYSTKDIQVLKWNTPLENQLNANIFNVLIDNKPMKYIGRIVKRGKPAKDDYILFSAGESRSVTVKLSQYYEMPKSGKYTIGYKGILKYKEGNKEKVYSSRMLKGTIPTLQIIVIPTQKKTLYSQKLPANFNGCSTSEIVSINDAHNEAIYIAKDASTVMNSASANTNGDRYITWFGSPDSTRQSNVSNYLNNIYSALDAETIVFDCTCSDDFFAYVYADEPYSIYLCNTFWTANTTGTDSQAGTIIHEMSHFIVLAGTDDHAYGQDNAKALAVSDPNNAVNNADNYEYFAENLPFLSMNDFFDTAVEIGNIIDDLPLLEDIAAVGEKDLYTFVATQSSQYTFFTTGTLDTIGVLYDSEHTQLIENDDLSDTEHNFSFDYTLVAGNRYYLAINAYNTDVGGYTLQSSMGELISDFVERFYVTILNRASDSAGLADWTSQLINGTKAAEDIAKGFINSVEFTDRKLDDTAYVTVLYKAFFNRDPDTDGLNGWLYQLRTGISRDSILDGFLKSQEFKNLAEKYGIKVSLTPIEQFVTRFYEQCLLRSPDAAGLVDWVTQLSNGIKSGADIARGFVFSTEFTNRGLSNEAYINVLYRAFFAREADIAGFNGWITQLNGGVSRAEVLDGFLGAQEFANLANTYGIRAN